MTNSEPIRKIDLNCDMGEWSDSEGLAHDALLMPFITSANIACGYHAGDETSMRETVSLALSHGVLIGAHPSFADREHFGRKEMHLSGDEIIKILNAQIYKLNEITIGLGGALHHVKPHGALYNMAAKDMEMANAIVRAVLDQNIPLILYGPAMPGCLWEAAKKYYCPFIREVFADRRYESDGSLTSRTLPGAVLNQEEAAIQVRNWLCERTFKTREGSTPAIEGESICVHGDNPEAIEVIKTVAACLRDKGFHRVPFKGYELS